MIAVELGALPLTLVLIVGFIAGAACAWVIRRFSDVAKIHEAVNQILAHLFEFRLFADEPSLILRSQWNLLAANGRMLRLLAMPALVLLLPSWMLFAAADGLFGRAALKPGESTIVTVQFRNAREALSGAQLVAPPGIAVETPALRIPRDAQVTWRLRAIMAVSGQLRVQSGRRVVTKTISSRPGLQPIAQLRAGTIASFVIHPLELPFSDPAIQSIGVRYPPAAVFRVSWLFWMSLASVAGAFAGAKIRGAL